MLSSSVNDSEVAIACLSRTCNPGQLSWGQALAASANGGDAIQDVSVGRPKVSVGHISDTLTWVMA